mmetsp:Transcript_26031/g.40620  ORF Transcript_26031/g.40620 Transcript_26031/m.40620 type:complete len:130 (-) Transcript_26031:1325-1714(-)
MTSMPLELKKARKLWKKTKEKFAATLKKYGAGNMKYNEFIGTIHKFCLQFGGVIQKKKMDKEREKKQHDRDEKRARGRLRGRGGLRGRGALRGGSRGGIKRNSSIRGSMMEGKGLMDNALKQMMSGDYD